MQAKSTTQQGAVFPQGKTAVAKRLGFSFEKPTVRRQSRLTRMKVGGAAAPPTPPKGFLTVWRAPAPQGTGARLPFQAEPQKKSLSLPWPAKAPASMGPEGFQRAIGKPFGRARRRETLPLQKNEKTLCQRSDAPPRFLAEPGARLRHASTWPSVDRVITWKGMALPLCSRAVAAARWMPPQQGTSMRTTVRLRMSLRRRISVSLAA